MVVGAIALADVTGAGGVPSAPTRRDLVVFHVFQNVVVNGASACHGSRLAFDGLCGHFSNTLVDDAQSVRLEIALHELVVVVFGMCYLFASDELVGGGHFQRLVVGAVPLEVEKTVAVDRVLHDRRICGLDVEVSDHLKSRGAGQGYPGTHGGSIGGNGLDGGLVSEDGIDGLQVFIYRVSGVAGDGGRKKSNEEAEMLDSHWGLLY